MNRKNSSVLRNTKCLVLRFRLSVERSSLIGFRASGYRSRVYRRRTWSVARHEGLGILDGSHYHGQIAWMVGLRGRWSRCLSSGWHLERGR
jgi:hypothetical protein